MRFVDEFVAIESYFNSLDIATCLEVFIMLSVLINS